MLLFQAHLAIVVLFGLSGCTDTTRGFAPQMSVAVTQSQEASMFISPALGATARQFLGATTGGTPTAAAPSPLIRENMLSPGSSTPYRLDHSRARSVSLQAVQPLRPNLSATARLGVGQGTLSYTLPQGLGVLRDPASVRFDTDFAIVEAGLIWHRPVSARVQADIGLAVGLRETRTTTHVSSALLDVRNTSRQSNPYLALRGDIELSPGAVSQGSRKAKVRLGSELRVFPDAGVNFGQTLSVVY